MSDRLAESRWLYNQPSSGRVANWWDRNKARFNGSWIDPQILDGAFILGTTSQDTDSSAKIRYSQDLVLVSKNGPEVPKEGSELWQIWQNYSQSEAGKADFNGSKLHLHGYSPFLTDRELRLQFSGYDWHRMRSLGLGLNDGTVPEHYRDGILPTLRPKG
ncbi:hypothetical protein HY025_04295, partial [Candidatus Daviesbacteria bacterium]|nr:hypothetical protein [Candidatus Daviesbacteria bacterium]